MGKADRTRLECRQARLPARRGGNGVEWVDDISGYGWVAHANASPARTSRVAFGVPDSPIACHAEAVREGRSILLRWLRFRCGCLSFAWPFPSLCRSSV